MSLLFISEVDPVNWWRDELVALNPTLEFVTSAADCDVKAIHYALVWNPPTGALARCPNLRVVFSLGAGVDHILRDCEYPRHVPLVRVVDDNLTRRMAEYVVLHCLMATREQRKLDACQREGVWRTETPVTASDVRIGIMGLGILGRNVAGKLCDLGFQVAGWSQTTKSIPGVDSFVGPADLDAFLKRTDILVCLLPHTPATENFLNGSVFRRLARDGVLDGPILINAGRGKVAVDEDVLAALDNCDLSAAVLDVFRQEPLPSDHPYWRHPRVTLTPHCAAVTDPRGIVKLVIENIRRFEQGKPLQDAIDIQKGY
jgi:glyoxylate/hydroxypyruvate reductase A